MDLIKRILGLNKDQAVELARALTFAEASRLGLELTEFSMSAQVDTADQGIDGTTNFPDDCPTAFPSGRREWQIKSGERTPNADDEFDSNRSELLRRVRSGSGYVLMWTKSPTEVVRQNVRQSFTEKVQEFREDARVDILFADQISELALQHQPVMKRVLGAPLGGLVPVDLWANAIVIATDFIVDPSRQSILDAIRDHVSREDSNHALHVLGDTGAGKSRVVYEALAVPGIADRVLVAQDRADVQPGFLSDGAMSPRSSLVLVVDDCSSESRDYFVKKTGLASGRIRLITVGARPFREAAAGAGRYLELESAKLEVGEAIALSFGLNDSDARRVADLAAGNPKLVILLARAMAYGADKVAISELVRGHPDIRVVLEKLVPDDARSALGVLALFDKLGFDRDVAVELSLASEHFGVAESEIRRFAERETGRLVSKAGRYRQVTPRLLAVRLGGQFIEEHPADFGRALRDLPVPLLESVQRQMIAFAGNEAVEEAFGELLRGAPFEPGGLSHLDRSGFRLLPIASVVAPLAAIEAIERLLEGESPSSLAEFEAGRRDMVWAIELLAWDKDLFDRAAECLLKLAVAESESIGNNATGVLKAMFHVHLGGTEATYDQRMRWARSRLDLSPREAIRILIDAVGEGLALTGSRMSADFGGRPEPSEWRPESVDDEMQARLSAWGFLIELARTDEFRADAGRVLARSIPEAASRGLAEQIIADIPTISWDREERSAMGHSVATASEFASEPSLASEFRELRLMLRGETVEERLDYVFSTSIWDLAESQDERRSGELREIVELAEALADAGIDGIVRAAELSIGTSEDTVFALFQAIATRLEDLAVFEVIESLRPVPDVALLGMFAAHVRVGGSDWGEGVVSAWLGAPDLAALVLRGAHILPATGRSAGLAVEAVKRRVADAAELGRYLFGGWTRPLPAESLLPILELLAGADNPLALDRALGILDQWMEVREAAAAPPVPESAVEAMALSLIEKSIDVDVPSARMNGFYRSRILPRLSAGYEVRLDIALRVLSAGSLLHLDRHDLQLIESLASERPTETVQAIVGLLVNAYNDSVEGRRFVFGDTELLTTLRRSGCSQDDFEQAFDGLGSQELAGLLGHVDFTGDVPDPVIPLILRLADDERLYGSASEEFMFPGHGWTGRESAHLAARAEAAKAWRVAGPYDASFERWLDYLDDAIAVRTALAIEREAER